MSALDTGLPRNGQEVRILVLDDEVDMLANYQRLLSRAGHRCHTMSNPSDLDKALDEFQPMLVLTDQIMPGCSGMEILERVKQKAPDIPVIIVTAHGSVESAVEAMHNRAADYLTKPFALEDLLSKIRKALQIPAAPSNGRSNGATSPPDFDWRQQIIGVSQGFLDILDLAQKVSRTDVNVLLLGESGTGKEVMARAIHRLSQRRKEIFVPVDCASLPENLLESELFGYRKGAFTGATSDKMGLFQFAHKGTLFLDEISDMPVTLQAKLLRVLQERRVRPVGGREEIEVDVRIIAATNVNLIEAVHKKAFRHDLYYRLNVVTLCLPSLRDRREDIPLLADYFLRQFVADNPACEALSIHPAAMARIQAYSWPGNVRELQNVIEHAATLACCSEIQVEDLPQAIRNAVDEKPPEPLFAGKVHLLGDYERRYLLQVLSDSNYNVSRAAEAAGCHRRTIYRMIHRHNVDLVNAKRQRKMKAKRTPQK